MNYLDWVRTLPCAQCGNPERSRAHHLLRVPNGRKGMGIRNKDRWAIPLCQPCHHALHMDGNEIRFLKGTGPTLAAVLWELRGNGARAVEHLDAERAARNN